MIEPSRPPELALRSVTRVYAPSSAAQVPALRDVSVTIEPGAFVSVEGPSGCGKTTLLNLLGLLDRPTSGEVLWDGVAVGEVGDREKSRRRLLGVGFIFQRFYLLPTLTAVENVELPMRARRTPGPERRARAGQLLAEVGLSGKEAAFPHQLSGGEEQRVAIARALANEPGVLLADEPTGELDSENAAQVLALLERVRGHRGSTLVLVTHNPDVAVRAQRHLVLKDGQIVTDRRST